jgi:hypothetical protein
MLTSRLYVSSYTSGGTPTHANGLVVVAGLMDGCGRFGRYLDHCDDELESLSQEDRVCEVSLSF